MKSDSFGNYLAGYYAGRSRSPIVYIGMRIGGIVYSIGANIQSGLNRFLDGDPIPAENWLDQDSIEDINIGLVDGLWESEP